MNLNYTYKEIASLFDVSTDDETIIGAVAFDSRKLFVAKSVMFFALDGVFRDGHDYIKDAYEKGVRHFVVSKTGFTEDYPDAHAIVVDDTLEALQFLAKHHRSKFSCEVVAITGSNGKTTVKEWLSHLLNKQFTVAKSPKSYNSKLGVALSLLEITPSTEVAIIEVGISGPGEMKKLINIIQPTRGILTSFGSGHRELFSSADEHFAEKIALFDQLDEFIYPELLVDSRPVKGSLVKENDFEHFLDRFPYHGTINKQNAQLSISMAKELGLSDTSILEGISEVNALTLRMETFDGVNNNTIINDTYNLDEDSLRHSLEYQLSNANGKDRIVIIGLEKVDGKREAEIRTIVAEYAPSEVVFHYLNDEFKYQYRNMNILIKGTRSAKMEAIARKFKLVNHQTYLEIDLKCIRHNINYSKSILNERTKLLCMVKASSYGSDAKTMGKFLEGMGVDYLGVAYPDEGKLLRESGVKTPILVMNCEESTFPSCIEYNLEPAIFSVQQLNSFISELIYRSIENYPVHVKLETGMNRLGFVEQDLPNLIDLVKSQPEVYIKSIYSHLADADQHESYYTKQQIEIFDRISSRVMENFNYPIARHILNSSGIYNYTHAQFDMVRLGIGMYGVMGTTSLRSSIKWYSTVSQLRRLTPGESVGYGRTFFADQETEIAVIPVGYADGYRRSLGRGAGGVFINDRYCPTVGNVCMDMIMVDVTGKNVQLGDRVEIIGRNQSMLKLADTLGTIPYEIMTSFSARMHRIFVDQ